MRTQMFLLALFLLQCGIARSQESPAAEVQAREPKTDQVRYFATLAEYRLDQAVPVLATEDDIVSLIQKQQIEPVETIRLTSVSNTKSHVQFGKRVEVTTGKAIVARGVTTRQTQTMEIGTILEVMIVPNKRGVMADISYTASRLKDGETEESPPKVMTTTIDTTQAFALGKLKLLGGSNTSDPSYVLITIIESP